MSDEEKKAIEYFKSNLEMTKEMGKKWGFQEEIKNNEILLNLIEKQSKEIEELKDTRSVFNMGRRSYKNEIEDKIKAKIEELDKKYEISKDENGESLYYYPDFTIRILQSLLEKE